MGDFEGVISNTAPVAEPGGAVEVVGLNPEQDVVDPVAFMQERNLDPGLLDIEVFDHEGNGMSFRKLFQLCPKAIEAFDAMLTTVSKFVPKEHQSAAIKDFMGELSTQAKQTQVEAKMKPKQDELETPPEEIDAFLPRPARLMPGILGQSPA